jgi:hypothetical protein
MTGEPVLYQRIEPLSTRTTRARPDRVQSTSRRLAEQCTKRHVSGADASAQRIAGLIATEATAAMLAGLAP